MDWPSKYPAEVLDYHIDWSARLSSETISNSEFTVISGDVTIDSENIAGKRTVVWLSGGTEDTTSTIRNVITTSANRVMEVIATIGIR